ncbi:hypothetical protein [Microcoleus sp. PH2017_30_WIL_O_A]|nr:hypothetical protein [Microcoleus sp. PH2017_30_WIL_O_A]
MTRIPRYKHFIKQVRSEEFIPQNPRTKVLTTNSSFYQKELA